MTQTHFAPLFAQDPPPPPPSAVDIPIVPPVVSVVDLKEDGIVSIFIADEVVEVKDRLELYDLAEPEVFPIALLVMPPEPVIEIVDLEDALPPTSDDDGRYDIEPRHVCRFKPWPLKV